MKETKKTIRRVGDSAWMVSEMDPATMTFWQISGVPAKLSTAWISLPSHETAKKQAIETTADELRKCGLISDEGLRAFRYRIGQREQVELYDFEDLDWLAGEIAKMGNARGAGVNLYGRMISKVGHSAAMQLWQTATQRFIDAHANALVQP